MFRCCLWALAAAQLAAELTTIYKVDFPLEGFCGQESNVEKSATNPHWLFPTTFGGFQEGNCSDVGYAKFKETRVVEMHPLPFVRHNISFDIYAPTQTGIITIELTDPQRSHRVVKAKLCMPSSRGTWPLYIFGHGAGCDPEDYLYFCQVAATAMIYQDSAAGPIFPADFDTAGAAVDAAFLAVKLPELSLGEATSPLFGKLDGTVVLGGHSMGGGVTVLAVGKEAARADGIAVFAPGLYTRPDATPFLTNVTTPALVVSGSLDCGTNALDKEAEPTFRGLSSRAKVLVVLKGANHCQWTQPFEHFFGICKSMSECHGIERAEQHRFGAQLVRAFMAGLGTEEGWANFERLLASGEADGSWTYISSKTSAPGKTVKNDCPCSAAEIDNLVI